VGSSETAQFLPNSWFRVSCGRRSLNSTHLERRSYAVVSIPRSDSLLQLAAALLLACGALGCSSTDAPWCRAAAGHGRPKR